MSKRLTAAAVERLRAKSKRQEIGDAGSQGLRLIIQPSGAKSWAMRFRRPDGRNAKLTLGSVDLSGREGGDAPRIGQPLTLREARLLASDVHRRRAAGEDVTARKGEAGDDAFAKVAAAFLRDYQREKRNWRDVAKALGLDAELQVIPGSLADRWGRRPVGSITTGDVHAVIAESIGRGSPASLPSRASPATVAAGRWATRSAPCFAGRPGTGGTRSRSTRWPACGDLDLLPAAIGSSTSGPRFAGAMRQDGYGERRRRSAIRSGHSSGS